MRKPKRTTPEDLKAMEQRAIDRGVNPKRMERARAEALKAYGGDEAKMAEAVGVQLGLAALHEIIRNPNPRLPGH